MLWRREETFLNQVVGGLWFRGESVHVPKHEKWRKEVVGAKLKRHNTILTSQYHHSRRVSSVCRVSENLFYAIKCRMIFLCRMVFRHRTPDPAGLNVDFNFLWTFQSQGRISRNVFVLNFICKLFKLTNKWKKKFTWDITLPGKQRSNWGYGAPAAPFVRCPYATG